MSEEPDLTEAIDDTILALEKGVEERLKDKIPGVAVEAMPDDPEAYRARHQRGALLVGCRNAVYGGRLDHDGIAQRRTFTVGVLVLLRQLNGHRGAYAYIEATRVALVGYEIDGFEPFLAAGITFLGHNNGTWMYSVEYTTESIIEAVAEEDVDDVIAELLNG
jgi:hypothetical protein